jgi:hypothetical protein
MHKCGLFEKDIEEAFVKSSGAGGQEKAENFFIAKNSLS